MKTRHYFLILATILLATGEGLAAFRNIDLAAVFISVAGICSWVWLILKLRASYQVRRYGFEY